MPTLPALATTLLLAALAHAQSAPRLLADLDARPLPRQVLSSSPDAFARLGAWTFFAAEDPEHGRELFRTNGTALGTGLFADLFPGPTGSSPRLLTAAGTKLFFVAADGLDGELPFVSDGSPGGTRRIPGLWSPTAQYSTAAAFGSRWVLHAWDASGQTLWVSDGTALGSVAIVEPSDLVVGERLSIHSPLVITAGSTAPELVFVSSLDSAGPSWLWRTDGTRAGTRRTPMPVPGIARLLAVVNDKAIVFDLEWSPSGAHRSHLVSWDGVNPPQVLLSQASWLPVSTDNTPVFDGRAWVVGGALNAFGLVTDGTPAGTRIIPRMQYGTPLQLTASLGVIGNAVWLAAGRQLFRVDPGIADPISVGTLPIDLSIAQIGPQFGTRRIVVFEDARLYALDVPSLTATNLGIRVLYLEPGSIRFGEGFGRAYFAHQDAATGTELWQTDGTVLGTRLLADLAQDPIRTQDSDPARFWGLGGGVAFVASDGQTQDSALWISDGTAAGTRVIAGGLTDDGFTATAAGRLFVQTQDPVLGNALVVTDGTTGGTRRIAIPESVFRSQAPVALGDEILMTGSNAGRPAILATDGTSLRLVRDFVEVAGPGYLVRLGERVVFQTGDGIRPVEIWSTDGTTGGTQPLRILAWIGSMTSWRDRVWFVARSSSMTSPLELWSSDGTPSGTRSYAPLTTLEPSTNLLATKARLFALSSRDLLLFDGQSPVPVVVSFPDHRLEMATPRVLGDRLVFDGLVWATGESVLWSSDGSAAGTLPITPPFRPSGAKLTPIGARHALFEQRYVDGQRGTWITDGTASGTRPYSDRLVFDAEHPFLARSLNAANGIAIVAMRDPIAGLEPHVIELDGSVDSLSRGCGGIGREAELFASLGPASRGGLTVEGRSSAGSVAFVLMSAAPQRPTPFPRAGRCVLDVDPNAFVVLLQSPLTNGRFVQSWPLPAEPALRGVAAVLQAAIALTDARLGFDLSNGLLVNLWR